MAILKIIFILLALFGISIIMGFLLCASFVKYEVEKEERDKE